MTAVLDAVADRVRRLRRAAHRHHRARGQRRHRQDVHDRRARRPVRRRGPRPPAGAAARHLRPRGHPGTARAGPRAAGERRARRCAIPPRRRTGADPVVGAAGGRPGRRGRAAPAPAHRRARRVRRRDHRDHAPVLRTDADGARHRRRRRRRGVRRVGGRPGRRGRRRLLRPQVRRQGRRHARVRPHRGAAAGPPGGRRPAGPARAGRGERHRGGAPAFATAVRGEVERRKRARGLHTYDDLVTRLHDALGRPRPRRRRSGCGPATGWCSSTSSRTPTRCSGASCGTSRGTSRWSSSATPSRRSTPSAARTSSATSTPSGRPTPTPRSPATGAATPGCCAPWTRVFGGAALGDPRIVVREVESAHPVPRLAGAPVDAPLRVRVLPRDGLACSGRGLVLTPEARALVARDVAADVAALLASGATIGGRPAAARRRRRPRPHERPGHGDARRARSRRACPRCSRAPRACSAPRPRGNG